MSFILRSGFVLLFAASQFSFSAENEDPETKLDLSANSPVFESYRRTQTQLGEIGFSQSSPMDLDTVFRFLQRGSLTEYDQHVLEWEPSIRPERMTWLDKDRGSGISVRPEAQTGATLTDEKDGGRSLFGIGMTCYGQVFHRLTYYTHGLVFTEKTQKAQFSHQFSPEYGETYSVEKSAGDSLLKDRTFNRHEYYLKYQGTWLSIKAGRDWVHFGPGYFSSLTASRDTPPYYLVDARLDFSPWLKVSTTLLRMTDTDHSILKYSDIHRFEFTPTKNLEIGFTDMVIYQDRDPDPRYFLPLTPITFTESNNGGLDNSAMSFDFLWATGKCVSIWGELFIDDLVGPTTFFDNFWENRWATLAGFQMVSPWRALDADLVVELSHVEPWTYIGRSPQTSFKQFNVPSASRLGPDSRSLDIRLAWRPWRAIELTSTYSQGAKGTGNQARLGAVHNDSLDGTTKNFLTGRVDSERLDLGIDVRMLKFLWAQLGLGMIEQPSPSLESTVLLRWAL